MLFQAIRDLPILCKVLTEFLPKIVDVLAQLLPAEDERELLMIHKALGSLFNRDVKGTLKGLFSQVKTGSDEVRERVVRFLSSKEGLVLGRENEFVLLSEVKAAVKFVEPEEFKMLMALIDKTSIPKSVTGQTQLLEIAANMAGLDEAQLFFDGSDEDIVNKFAFCAGQATNYFSV